MALALYNSLQGEAEQELEHTPIEDLFVDDGVDKIVEALRAPMEQKVVYQKRKYLNEFENIRRYAGLCEQVQEDPTMPQERWDWRQFDVWCREHGCKTFG